MELEGINQILLVAMALRANLVDPNGEYRQTLSIVTKSILLLRAILVGCFGLWCCALRRQRKSLVGGDGGVGLVFLVFAVAGGRANKDIGVFRLVGDA